MLVGVGGYGAGTMIERLVVVDFPHPSVTVRVTLYVPAAGNVWLIDDEVLVGVPSVSKFHR